MKKLVGLTVAILLFSLTISAQQKQERSRKGSDFTPEQTATLMTKKMTLALDLDKNQETAVYGLMKENIAERQNAMAEMKKRKESGTKPTNDEKFEIQNNRLDKMIAHKAAMKKILSKEQFEKWEKSMHSKMKKEQQRSGQKQGMKKGGQKTTNKK